jgi:hypothetical protein
MAKYYFKTGSAVGRHISWKLTNGITGAVSWTGVPHTCWRGWNFDGWKSFWQ